MNRWGKRVNGGIIIALTLNGIEWSSPTSNQINALFWLLEMSQFLLCFYEIQKIISYRECVRVRTYVMFVYYLSFSLYLITNTPKSLTDSTGNVDINKSIKQFHIPGNNFSFISCKMMYLVFASVLCNGIDLNECLYTSLLYIQN